MAQHGGAAHPVNPLQPTSICCCKKVQLTKFQRTAPCQALGRAMLTASGGQVLRGEALSGTSLSGHAGLAENAIYVEFME